MNTRPSQEKECPHRLRTLNLPDALEKKPNAVLPPLTDLGILQSAQPKLENRHANNQKRRCQSDNEVANACFIVDLEIKITYGAPHLLVRGSFLIQLFLLLIELRHFGRAPSTSAGKRTGGQQWQSSQTISADLRVRFVEEEEGDCRRSSKSTSKELSGFPNVVSL